ncbi:MAG TPA: Spo0B domain-containing protein [Syntrophomonadaceae bacterium]|nr:Spo0B domain-containing protein [Syntrophomonadaceae bacterium]
MEEAKFVEILRRCRHDFGNHLQVISGYTELGRSDKVKEYIEHIVKKMASERIIFDSLPADAALYFYDQVLLAADLGVILIYQDLKIENWQILKDQTEPIKSLAPLAAGISKEEEPVIFVSLQEDEKGVMMAFSSQYFAENISLRINK